MSERNISKTHTQRITANTVILYLRQLFCMAIALYTVRVVLNILGAVDYGIYTVVAGTVMLLSFLNATMTSATQRFFAFALGRSDRNMLKEVFGTNLVVYGGIVFFSIFVFETAGLWFVHNKLNIPADKLESVQILYQFAVASFCITMIAAPYTAILIAYEEMNIYAYLSIADACLKLIVVLLLPYLPYAKLPCYGALLCLEAVIITGAYGIICYRKYPECTFSKIRINRQTLKEIANFTSWTLFGALSNIFRAQTITILINQFFSPITVAARAIAMQLSAAANAFTANFNTSLYPPIIKEWSAGNTEQMYKLIYIGCKITFFLTWLFALPFILEMDWILSIWLDLPPEEATLFSRLVLVESVILSVSYPLMTAARAEGHMKQYELTLGVIQICIFPVSWLILARGCPAWSTLLVAICANIVMFFVRLLIVHKQTALPIVPFLKKVCLPIGTVSLISIVLAQSTKWGMRDIRFHSIATMCISGGIILGCIYLFGLDRQERRHVESLIRARLTSSKQKDAR